MNNSNIVLRWSKNEDDIIRKYAELYPTNLSLSFKEAEKELPGRTVSGISQRWNKHLKFGEPVIGVISKSGAVSNVKNTPRLTDRNPLVEIVELSISLLTKEERINIIKKLLNQLK